ncbi:MAG: hypothetical protein AMXMBFR33_28010 [Candidatus Xenobia bacterium]
MNVLATLPTRANLQGAPPPGARYSLVSPDQVNLSQPPCAETIETDPVCQISPYRKSVVAVCLCLSGLTGLGAAVPALAAQVAHQTQQADDFKVVVVPHGTPRVDLIAQTEKGPNDEVTHVPYSEVGVYLGDGLFHDSNGNLSYLPTDAHGWTPALSQFQRVDVEVNNGRDKSVSRFGNTVHFTEGSTKRHVFTDQGEHIEQLSRREKAQFDRTDDQIRVSSEKANYTVTRGEGGTLTIAQPGKDNIVLYPGITQTRIGQGERLIGRVTVRDEGRMTVEGQRGKSEVMRSAGGGVLQVDGRQDYRLTREADGTLHIEKPGGDHRMRVDNPEKLQLAQERYQAIVNHLEAREPGYTQKHPVIMAILEYAAHNPDILDGEEDAQAFLQAGTQLTNVGGAAVSGVAMIKGATALSLAERAHALGSAALAAKAGAEAAARAGNLAQAAGLAGEARALGEQARSIGAEAMQTGKGAQNAAKVAQVMLGVAATLEIVDGGWGIHEGASNRSLVEGAIAVTEARMQELRGTLTGAELERATEDYSKVMNTLEQLRQNAKKQVRVGGLKVGCGSLLLVSALMGPKAPVALGAVGIACTAGTSIYEHWDKLESFFDKDAPQRPTLIDILPDDEIVLKLDDGTPLKIKRD